MKVFVLAAAALAMTVGASAATITEFCVTWTNNTPTTVQNGSLSCASFASYATGGTLTGAFLVEDSDYSTGLTGAQSESTTYTYSGVTLAGNPDTLTTTGASSSSSQCSTDFGCSPNANNSPVLAGFYDNISAGAGNAITGSYSNQMTTGNAIADTGYVQEVFTYTPATTSPEPGSMMLLGGGLLAAGLIGRKKLVRK